MCLRHVLLTALLGALCSHIQAREVGQSTFEVSGKGGDEAGETRRRNGKGDGGRRRRRSSPEGNEGDETPSPSPAPEGDGGDEDGAGGKGGKGGKGGTGEPSPSPSPSVENNDNNNNGDEGDEGGAGGKGGKGGKGGTGEPSPSPSPSNENNDNNGDEGDEGGAGGKGGKGGKGGTEPEPSPSPDSPAPAPTPRSPRSPASAAWVKGAVGQNCNAVCGRRACVEGKWPKTLGDFKQMLRTMEVGAIVGDKTCSSIEKGQFRENPGQYAIYDNACYWYADPAKFGKKPVDKRCPLSHPDVIRYCPCSGGSGKNGPSPPRRGAERRRRRN